MHICAHINTHYTQTNSHPDAHMYVHTHKNALKCAFTHAQMHTHMCIWTEIQTRIHTHNVIVCLFLFHTGTHKQIHADTHRHTHRHTQPHRIHTQRTTLIYRSLWIFFTCMIFCFWINWMSRRKHFKKLTQIDLWLLHRNLTFHQMSSYGIQKFKLVLKLSLKHEYSFEIIMH